MGDLRLAPAATLGDLLPRKILFLSKSRASGSRVWSEAEGAEGETGAGSAAAPSEPDSDNPAENSELSGCNGASRAEADPAARAPVWSSPRSSPNKGSSSESAASSSSSPSGRGGSLLKAPRYKSNDRGVLGLNKPRKAFSTCSAGGASPETEEPARPPKTPSPSPVRLASANGVVGPLALSCPAIVPAATLLSTSVGDGISVVNILQWELSRVL